MRRPRPRPRRRAVRLLAAGALAAAAAVLAFVTVVAPLVDRRMNAVVGPPPPVPSAAAAAAHARLTVVDLHADPLLWPRDLTRRADHGHVDLPRLAEGNVALQVFAAVTRTPRGLNYVRNDSTSDNVTLLAVAERWPPATWRSLRARALHQAAVLEGAAARSGGALVLVRTRRDLDALLARRGAAGPGGGPPTAARPVGALLALEGAHPLEGRLANLDTLFAAGYRMVGLTHFFDNEVAGSSAGVRRHGLTPLGRRVVRRAEALGMVVDLAHAAPRTVDDVLAVAARPVVVSHTGVAALCPSPRNLTDDQLRRVAATGGVVGIGYWEGALCADLSPAAVARAVRHAVAVAGVDHVALGSDFDGATRTRFDAAGLARVTAALAAAGLDSAAVAKVAGLNAARVLRSALPP